uniref:Saccharopine dehydrogenase n=1 Tax=candidate division WOR-3 bacterium TaxID=2052148 RepID=A0A7C4UGN4_UNCW3
MGKVLVLGAGLVSKPMVTYLLKKGLKVVVASRTVSKAEELIKGFSNGEAKEWVISEKDRLKEMVKDADVVVSLLPWVYHLEVADVCIEYRKHMVTTSYVQEKMQALDEKAKDAGIIILNEIGLDPGIDHMSAMRTIHRIWREGGRVLSFRSVCGALPAPEASNIPFRYKFSWSPKGVALAGRNSARYKKDGKIIEIKSEELFKTTYTTEVENIGILEVYPNRDSIPYLEKYGIKDADTIFRGTLRYPGWCETWFIISNTGLLGIEEKEWGDITYLEFFASVMKVKPAELKKEIMKRFNVNPDSVPMKNLEFLGLFSDNKIKTRKGAAIDILVELLVEKLSYKDGERDMVILKDEVVGIIRNREKKFISTLIDFGTVGEETAVARTVSLPAAIAVRKIINGEIKNRGVLIPTIPDIYEPVLDELVELGISSKEEEIEL